MLAASFLHTVTIKTKSVTYSGTRQQTPTWAESETGVNATISPMASMSYRYSFMGPTTDATHLLFLEAGTTVSQDDVVVDEADNKEYVVTTTPTTYKNPATGEDSHIQCEIKPREPNS